MRRRSRRRWRPATAWSGRRRNLSPLCGAKLEESLREAGLPEGLVAVVQGGPAAGRALVESAIDKAMFTGGVEGGPPRPEGARQPRDSRRWPSCRGSIPAIVLADAPLESTVRCSDLGGLRRLRADLRGGEARLRRRRPGSVGRGAGRGGAGAAGRRPGAAGDRRRADDLVEGPGAIPRDDRGGERRGVRRSWRAVGRSATRDPSIRRRCSWSDSSQAEEALAGAFGPVVIVRGFAREADAVEAANRSPISPWRPASGAGMSARRAGSGGLLHAGLVSDQ